MYLRHLEVKNNNIQFPFHTSELNCCKADCAEQCIIASSGQHFLEKKIGYQQLGGWGGIHNWWYTPQCEKTNGQIKYWDTPTMSLYKQTDTHNSFLTHGQKPHIGAASAAQRLSMNHTYSAL